MATAPLLAAAFAKSMLTCFAPDQDCAALATSAIDGRYTGLYNPNSCVSS